MVAAPKGRRQETGYRETIQGIRNLRLDICNARLGFRNMRLDFCNARLDFRNIRLDFRNIRLDFRNARLDICNARLGFRNMRPDFRDAAPAIYNAGPGFYCFCRVFSGLREGVGCRRFLLSWHYLPTRDDRRKRMGVFNYQGGNETLAWTQWLN